MVGRSGRLPGAGVVGTSLVGAGLMGAVVLAGCASAPAPSPTATAVRASCAVEAERLRRPVALQVDPAATGAVLAELQAGRFVYRCTRQGDWLAVMFPAAGEPVDCTDRPAGRACAIGWTRGEIETEIYG